MKLHLGRIWVLGLVAAGAAALNVSCASSEEGVFNDPLTSDAGDASNDGSGSGGFSGSSGSGGFSGSGVGGSTGGTGGSISPAGGTGGVGVGGTGGDLTGGTGGVGGGGTCNPAFCPNPGFGTPCCVGPNGPCGTDNGMTCSAVGGDP